MKKLLYLLPLFLASCGKFSDGTSIWAGGLWIMLVLIFGGAIAFFIYAWRISKSKNVQYAKENGVEKLKEFDEYTPIYKIGFFWFAVFLVLAGIGAMIWQYLER